MSRPISDESLKNLSRWFRARQRILPWRENPTLYRVWISEIMLQQTQVVTVVPYFERFLGEFPDVETLASAKEAEVMKAWAGLGYYSRARNLHRAAKTIVAAGGFPMDRAGWEAIPGVGPYTAGAILSIALNQAEALVDGNVERVYSRHRRWARAELGDAEFKSRVWSLAREATSRLRGLKLRPSDVNQAWMELGATICVPATAKSVRGPKCELCPIAGDCDGKKKGDAVAYPGKKKRAEWRDVRESCVAVFTGDFARVLLRERKKGEWRAGMWDLPPATDGEGTPGGRAGLAGALLGTVESKHVVTHHKILRRTAVRALETAKRAALASAAMDGLRWVDWRDPEVALSSAAKKTLQLVVERYASGAEPQRAPPEQARLARAPKAGKRARR